MSRKDAPERRLIQLLCSTTETRRVCVAEISRLVRGADAGRLLALLQQTGLLLVAGERLLNLGGRDFPELEREISAFSTAARRWGAATELATLDILDRLATAGIRALPLKGSVLARELYGDVAARNSVDIDILVAPEELRNAVALLSELGWRWESDAWRVDGLPVLHETLVHRRLPRVELHWRLHWYERQFASDALSRAEPSATRAPLVMQPVDGLIALMLFYARDGFTGLRFPTDAATWWDVRCSEYHASEPLDAILERYPDLAGPVRVASVLLSDLVGLPMRLPTELPFRWRVAATLATPFMEAGRQQISANAALADLLLAPRSGAADAIRRLKHNAPAGSQRTETCVPTPPFASMGHLPRVLGRWIRAAVPAIARIWLQPLRRRLGRHRR